MNALSLSLSAERISRWKIQQILLTLFDEQEKWVWSEETTQYLCEKLGKNREDITLLERITEWNRWDRGAALFWSQFSEEELHFLRNIATLRNFNIFQGFFMKRNPDHRRLARQDLGHEPSLLEIFLHYADQVAGQMRDRFSAITSPE